MLGEAARLPAVSHHARNASSPATTGSDDAEHVEALVDGIRVDRDRRVRVGGVDLGADRVVGSVRSVRAAPLMITRLLTRSG